MNSIPNSTKKTSFKDSQKYTFNVGQNNILHIPYRVYSLSDFKEDDNKLLISTRHHNGHQREKSLIEVVDKIEPAQSIPYILLLASEYVVEIITYIYENFDKYEVLAVKFIQDNNNFYTYFKSRVVSYWNEYYRNQYPSFSDYPGYKIIQKIEKIDPSLAKYASIRNLI